VKILIAGAAGLVGSHLTRRLCAEHDVTPLTHADLDSTDRDAVHRIVAALRPELIYNCAVLQVDDCERDAVKAETVNVRGPQFLAEAANTIGAEIVQFSTQYAFAGEPIGRPPYTVKDEPEPVNVYGRTKVAGENAVREACARSYIVRTSWVYGSGKNSFLCVVHDDLKAGKKVRAIDDIWSSTTYVEDLIDRCLEIIRPKRYGTYHVVNEGPCTYYEFALEAGRLAGLPRDQIDSLIEITHERDMHRIAARPRYTPLRCLLSEEMGLAPMRHWKAALAGYVGATPSRVSSLGSRVI
jgi:dTDP-4-dehydrorhamnose reductase